MNIIITKSGHEKSWYSKSIGQTFEVIEPPTWARYDSEDDVFYIKHSRNSTGEALFVWKDDCELVLPKSPDSTEILNEVKADKGILTEEELKERNRLLVLENDEQAAEIEKLKWICKRSSDFIDAMVGFTGQNLSVFNWHQNGDGEPFDNFVEENLEENLVTDLKTALEELK